VSAIPELRTARLLLRPWRDGDIEPLAAMNADAEVMKHFPGPLSAEQSAEQMRNMQAGFAQHGYDFWAAELPGESSFIGFIGVRRVPARFPFAPAVELGWRLARPYWKRGLAQEGARASVDFAFDALALSELLAYTAATNRRSRRLMERLGMARDPREDFLHPAIPAGHRLQPHVLYRLAPARWRAER
jgi:RimJ/RimL family protein N-acetyltransferase